MKLIKNAIITAAFFPAIWTFRACGSEFNLKNLILNCAAWLLLLMAIDFREWLLDYPLENKLRPGQTSKVREGNC